MRLLFWSLLALAELLDAGADLCTAVVATVHAVAWTVSQPFALACRACLALSRRITSGRSAP